MTVNSLSPFKPNPLSEALVLFSSHQAQRQLQNNSHILNIYSGADPTQWSLQELDTLILTADTVKIPIHN